MESPPRTFENVVDSDQAVGEMMLSAALRQSVRNSSPRSGAAPEPEGPKQVGERFKALNRPKPWDLPSQAGRLLGKLDLKAGATVVVLAEILNAVAGEHITRLAGLPYPGGALAFVLPALAGFFHRKEKGKDSDTDRTDPAKTNTPHEVAAAVSDSRKSPWRNVWEKAKSSFDEF